jgi:hypothetical protein
VCKNGGTANGFAPHEPSRRSSTFPMRNRPICLLRRPVEPSLRLFSQRVLGGKHDRAALPRGARPSGPRVFVAAPSLAPCASQVQPVCICPAFFEAETNTKCGRVKLLASVPRPRTKCQGPKTRDQGPGTKDQGPRTSVRSHQSVIIPRGVNVLRFMKDSFVAATRRW